MCHAINPDTGQSACFDVTIVTDAARSCARRVLAVTGLDTTLSVQPVARQWVSMVDQRPLGQ